MNDLCYCQEKYMEESRILMFLLGNKNLKKKTN